MLLGYEELKQHKGQIWKNDTYERGKVVVLY